MLNVAAETNTVCLWRADRGKANFQEGCSGRFKGQMEMKLAQQARKVIASWRTRGYCGMQEGTWGCQARGLVQVE